MPDLSYVNQLRMATAGGSRIPHTPWWPVLVMRVPNKNFNCQLLTPDSRFCLLLPLLLCFALLLHCHFIASVDCLWSRHAPRTMQTIFHHPHCSTFSHARAWNVSVDFHTHTWSQLKKFSIPSDHQTPGLVEDGLEIVLKFYGNFIDFSCVGNLFHATDRFFTLIWKTIFERNHHKLITDHLRILRTFHHNIEVS